MRKIAVWIMIEDFLLKIPNKQSKPHSISKITIKSITLTRHFSSADLSCLLPNATFASFISNFKYACDILQISSKLTWNSVAFFCEKWFGWRFDWTQFEVMILSVCFFLWFVNNTHLTLTYWRWHYHKTNLIEIFRLAISFNTCFIYSLISSNLQWIVPCFFYILVLLLHTNVNFLGELFHGKLIFD